jgi:ribose transport system substrate-binding protein
MFSILRKLLLTSLVIGGLASAVMPSAAAEVQQVGREAYLKTLKGKKVIFVPISQGFDLNQAWVTVWQRHAQRYGFTLEVRDPNMNTEAGIRALTGAIAEKPDLLIVQNPDVQTYARQLKQAQDAGIPVLQVNMQSATQTDSYVGNDWIEMGRLEMGELAKACAKGKGPSTKVVWLAGVETGAANIYMRQGINEVLAANPDLQLVSDQAAKPDRLRQRQEGAPDRHLQLPC